MSVDLNGELKIAEEKVRAVKAQLNKLQCPDHERSTVMIGFTDQALEHHAAIILMLRSGLIGSAFALTRSVTEILVRGVWITICASDAQVMKFAKHDKLDLTFGEMSEAIDTTCGLNYFLEFKRQSWAPLNSYAHTGMLQIGRRFTGDLLRPSYTDDEKVEVLRAITFSILLLVRPYIAKYGGADSAKEIDKLMVPPK